MDVRIEPSWKALLQQEFDKPYFAELTQFVRNEYASTQVFPPAGLIFNAFDTCPLEKTKVVILGQDPYHGVGQAHGLSFSVPDGIAIPKSLINIYQEIRDDLGVEPPRTGNLTHWAEQGVLLLNTTLTVRAHLAASHQGHGWERFTDEVIRLVSQSREHVVFMLWGAPAGRKAELIDPTKHLILRAPHPSPLSAYRGFFGCKHFSKANAYLVSTGQSPIEWV